MAAKKAKSRRNWVKSRWHDYGRNVHHGINEVWSNDFAKWIVLDAKDNNHFEKAGMPLSALETHEAVGKNGGPA